MVRPQELIGRDVGTPTHAAFASHRPRMRAAARGLPPPDRRGAPACSPVRPSLSLSCLTCLLISKIPHCILFHRLILASRNMTCSITLRTAWTVVGSQQIAWSGRGPRAMGRQRAIYIVLVVARTLYVEMLRRPRVRRRYMTDSITVDLNYCLMLVFSCLIPSL